MGAVALRFEPAITRHARLIASAMRPGDIEEIRAGWDKEPLEAMRIALTESYYARTMFMGLQPLCMYGLAPLTVLTGCARIWIFVSTAVDAHPFAFARASRVALREVMAVAPIVTNLVDVQDEPVMKWLEWLGGRFVSPPMERGGRLFAQFVIAEQGRAGEKKKCRQV